MFFFSCPVLRIRIRVPMLFWPRDPGWIKNQDPGWTFRIIFARAWKQFLGLKILKFFNADPDPWSRISLILYPGSGMEKFESGINIPDSLLSSHSSETLLYVNCAVCGPVLPGMAAGLWLFPWLWVLSCSALGRGMRTVSCTTYVSHQ